MSTQQTSGPYKVVKVVSSTTPWLFRLVDESARTVFEPYFIDVFRSEAAAEYSARILNDGRATIDLHAPVGCKVMPV